MEQSPVGHRACRGGSAHAAAQRKGRAGPGDTGSKSPRHLPPGVGNKEGNAASTYWAEGGAEKREIQQFIMEIPHPGGKEGRKT